VLPAPCHVISDVHLGVAPPGVEAQLLAFLRMLPAHGGSLVINGDLFDFWFEWKSVVPRTGVRVIAALAELRDRGIPVLWLAGNHDCWGGDVLREDYGIEYRTDPWEGSLAGWSARVDHGDGLRPKEDRGYRALRRVIRHPWSIRAFRALHPDLGTRLATGSSHASRTYMPDDGDAGLRGIAHAELARRPELELLVYGHSHVRRLERVDGGGVYANPGTWMDSPCFLRVTPERIELRRADGSPEGERLDVLDRLAQKALAKP
jgi:UDP-2,3-diacylglucosamine hydrolase